MNYMETRGAFQLSKKNQEYWLETKSNSHFSEISNWKKRTTSPGSPAIPVEKTNWKCQFHLAKPREKTSQFGWIQNWTVSFF